MTQEMENISVPKILWVQTTALAGVQASISLMWLIYNLYLPQLLTQLGFDPGLAVGLVVIENILGMFLEPLFGALSDGQKRWVGVKFPFISTGVAIASALFLAIPSIVTFADPNTPTRSLLPIVLVAWSFAMAIFRSPVISLLGKYATRPELPLAASLLTLVGGIINAIKPISTKFFLALGPVLCFAIGSFVLLGAAAVLRFVNPPETPKEETPIPQPFPWYESIFIFGTGCGIAWGSRLLTEVLTKMLQLQFGNEQNELFLVWIGLILAIAAVPAGICATKIGNNGAMVYGIAAILPLMFLMLNLGATLPILALTIAAYSLILNGAVPFALSRVPLRWSGFIIGMYFAGFSLAMALFGIVFPKPQAIAPQGGVIGVAIAFLLVGFCISTCPKKS